MKCVEIVLNGLNETNHLLSDLEIKLASFREMPSELEALKSVNLILYFFLQYNIIKIFRFPLIFLLVQYFTFYHIGSQRFINPPEYCYEKTICY